MRPWTNKTLGFGVFGIFLVTVGSCLYLLCPLIFHLILQSEMPLSESSRSYDLWRDTTALPPMYMKVHFFNWTNPEELMLPNFKPNLVQVGPYAFREIRKKVNITFYPDNNTVSYLHQKFWYFDQDHSNGSLTDNITQLNAVALSAAHKVRYWGEVMQNTLSFVLTSSKVHITKTVDELLFGGYDDTLIKLGQMAVTEEDVPPFDKFGWFYMRNGSTEFDEMYNMDTGAADIRNFGIIRNWNYRDVTKYNKSPCNIVEGSAGEFWPPNRTKDDITLFSGDICRPLIYEYAETVKYHGLEGYKYSLGSKSLGNNTKRRYPHEQAKYFLHSTTTEDFFDAEHSAELTDSDSTPEDPDVVNTGHCYCNGKCTPSGLMNITACRYGAPAFVSLPHFHKADASLRERVNGMNPTDEHDFYITLEPTTGIPLEVSANLQVNLLLQPSKSISLFSDVPTIYFPVFWFSLIVRTPEPLTDDLKQLLSLPSIFAYTGIVTLVVGAVIIFTLALLYALKKQDAATMPTAKNVKGTFIPGADKAELVYLDKGSANEDAHVRSDRKLYPSSIECFNLNRNEKKSEMYE